ncbi:MAG: AEC family transporter [Oscillospiraceae bacterium]|nr:AEC family transporter [Oscillospiraceae bacterium]
MAVFEQVLILFSFVTLGYILSKSGKVNPQHGKVLSAVLVNVLLPFNILKAFWENFTVEYLTEKYVMVTLSLTVLLLLSLAAFLGGKLFSKHPYLQKVYEYSLVIPNMGYMGYPLAEAMFGMTGLMDLMMFGIPVNLYIYIYGYPILTKTKLSLKALLNPVIITMAVAMILGLSGLQMPELLKDILNKGSVCMGPVSMLLTGIVISEYNLKEILGGVRIYIMSALRLVVIPVMIGVVLGLFADKEIVRIAVLLYALPCGLNTVVFPKLVNENCKIGAGLALVSHLAACATIPLVFWLFNL